MFRQSFCGWCFRDRGVADASLLRAAKEIGYDGVEFFPVETWPLVKDAGLAIATHSGHPLAAEGLNGIEHHSRLVEIIKANLDLAEKHGVGSLVVFAGNRQSGLSDEEALLTTAQGLRLIAPLAEQAKVNLVIELLNSKIDHVGYQCDQTRWANELCRMVASPRVKVLFDVYHVQVMEGDLIRSMRQAAPYIGHYHTAGNPGRNDMDDDQEINYRAIRNEIISSGYSGYVGHEFLPKGNPVSSLRQAYQLFHSTI